MKISIVTVSFNSEKTIEDTIKSVISQTYTNIEYIIIDGKSTDRTLTIINQYKDKISHIVSEKDNGIYDAMNKGINLATGDIIGILNSDDVYFDTNVLERVAKEFQKIHSDVVWGNIVYVKKDDLNTITRKWISSDYKDELFKKGWHPPHPAFFVKKDIYQKYGVFVTNFKIAADYEFMLRVLEKYKVSSSYISQYLVKMREGGTSNWKNFIQVIKGNIECYRSWNVIGKKPPIFLFISKIFYKIQQVM